MADEPEKRTHAQRRRLQSQQAIRRKLQAGQYVRRLHELADKAESVEASEVPAMRLKADIYLRLLAKCLPDLKAVEHSGSVTRRDITDKPLTAEEWTTEYADGVAAPVGSPESTH